MYKLVRRILSGHYATCGGCGGSGTGRNGTTCGTCGGTGQVFVRD